MSGEGDIGDCEPVDGKYYDGVTPEGALEILTGLKSEESK